MFARFGKGGDLPEEKEKCFILSLLFLSDKHECCVVDGYECEKFFLEISED